MPRLLLVHHTPSPTLHTMLEEARGGATDPSIDGVEVVVRAALEATAVDVLEADGYLLGCPANLGYLAGAMKHFFDLIYYPCLESTAGRPFGGYLHGNDDTGGAEAALAKITTGLRWKQVQPVLAVRGELSRDERGACRELGAVVSATLAAGLA